MKGQPSTARGNGHGPMLPSVVVPGSPQSYWKSLGAKSASMVEGELSARPQPAMPGQRMSRVMAFIDENLSVDLYISTLAEVAGMSSFYFCRTFKQTIGTTPHQFVLGRRMELAKHLLRHERMPLMEVAQKVGFTDQSQFTRVFRKIVGTTPSQFRKLSVAEMRVE